MYDDDEDNNNNDNDNVSNDDSVTADQSNLCGWNSNDTYNSTNDAGNAWRYAVHMQHKTLHNQMKGQGTTTTATTKTMNKMRTMRTRDKDEDKNEGR